jgi:hypothetical protein
MLGPPADVHRPGGGAAEVPQAAQNLAPGANSTPQFVQWVVAATSPVPQFWQNLAPVGLPVWQAAQVTPGGAVNGCDGGCGAEPAGGGPA